MTPLPSGRIWSKSCGCAAELPWTGLIPQIADISSAKKINEVRFCIQVPFFRYPAVLSSSAFEIICCQSQGWKMARVASIQLQFACNGFHQTCASNGACLEWLIAHRFTMIHTHGTSDRMHAGNLAQ